jgi:hypothetical protein
MFGRRSDRELAATKYAGRESATDRNNRHQRERGSMGTPHPTVAGAANAGEDFRLGTPPRRHRRR